MKIDLKAVLNHLLRRAAERPELTENLSQSQIEKLLKDVAERIESEPAPKIAFIGETGVGKSSTLNALFNAGLEVSHTRACTQVETEIEVSVDRVEGSNGVLTVYDMPGLGESKATRDRHLETYSRILKETDVALWILDAHDRAIEYVQEQLTTEIKGISPNLVTRMVFALNKVDLVYPGETCWSPFANLPSAEQERNIRARIDDVESRIREAVPAWEGAVIGYSATKRYNLPQLFAIMLQAVPQRRQWVLGSRKALADFFECVDPDLLVSVGKAVGSGGSKRESRDERLSRIVGELSEDELKDLARDKNRLQQWLKEHFA